MIFARFSSVLLLVVLAGCGGSLSTRSAKDSGQSGEELTELVIETAASKADLEVAQKSSEQLDDVEDTVNGSEESTELLSQELSIEDGDELTESTIETQDLPLGVTLTAMKEYSPSKWTNASASYSDPVTFEVPASVPVTSGNAGNHWLDFHFTLANGESVYCKYKGGADISKPLKKNNHSQIAKGLLYHFDHCDNGVTDGEVVSATDLVLAVANGDKTETTVVEMTLDFIRD